MLSLTTLKHQTCMLICEVDILLSYDCENDLGAGCLMSHLPSVLKINVRLECHDYFYCQFLSNEHQIYYRSTCIWNRHQERHVNVLER